LPSELATCSCQSNCKSGQKNKSHKNNYCILLEYKKAVYWDLKGAYRGQVAEIFRHDSFWAVPSASLPRSVGKTAVASPYQLNLPTNALIGIKVRRRLGGFVSGQASSYSTMVW
jgi:hypothetical protein